LLPGPRALPPAPVSEILRSAARGEGIEPNDVADEVKREEWVEIEVKGEALGVVAGEGVIRTGGGRGLEGLLAARYTASAAAATALLAVLVSVYRGEELPVQSAL